MRRPLVALTATVVAALAAPALAGAAPDRFDTGLQDPLSPGFVENDPSGAYAAARASGAHVIHTPAAWSDIAPSQPAHPADPSDPAYDWGALDRHVRDSSSGPLEAMIVFYSPPEWARETRSGKTILSPRPAAFGAFVKAAARRYNGKGHPRVRYWETWNEADLFTYLDQRDPVNKYRAMLNAAYKALHGVSKSNVVIAGGLSPFAGVKGKSTPPLKFLANLICMSNSKHPKPTCSKRPSFDAFSHHPYTSGGPTHKAFHAGDVSLGDLPAMHRLLRAGERAHHIKSRGAVKFFVSEISWDTKPPDPGGVPAGTHARWTAEAFYRMWQNGVSMAIWFGLRDNPEGSGWGESWQSGLFFRTTTLYRNEKPKPVLAVFRFPFVALPGKRATIWGRTPDGKRHPVLIQKRSGKKWKKVAKVKSGRHGIFRLRKRGLNGKTLRARVGKRSSRSYKVVRNRDIPVNAFGGNGPLH